MEIFYEHGTIVVKGGNLVPPFFKYDKRVRGYRAFAIYYRRTIEYFKRLGVELEDRVFDKNMLSLKIVKSPSLRDYQKKALHAWISNNFQGVIVLPTGSGKTRIALAAMAFLKVPTLIVVPTLELMDQRCKSIRKYFSTVVGRFGGGRREIKPVTVVTYDSAYLNIEQLGNKFKLIVFDEVHHLPSPSYRQIAEMCAAPYRMGLTATPEREDGRHEDLNFLVGPIVYRAGVPEFSGKYLAEYELKVIKVKLGEEEKKQYKELMEKYKNYLKKTGIQVKSLKDFHELIMRTGLDKEAREALLAWHKARKIAFNAKRKMGVLKEILAENKGAKILIFTENNEMLREISTQLLIPEISYKTPAKERKMILDEFRKGGIKVVATSKVLEEGLDVPDANVAIIVSGTGSRREFIQRLGRILRPKEGKARLYEIVTAGTKEVRVSKKRRRGIE